MKEPAHIKTALLLFLSLPLLAGQGAYALEPLIFNKTHSYTDAPKGFDETTLAAKVYLNNDDIPEWIITAAECDGECTFAIIATQNDEIVHLGIIAGKSIALGERDKNGIKTILVYDDENNDYKARTAYFHLPSRSYKMTRDFK